MLNTRGFAFIYVILMVTLAGIFGLIIVNKQSFFEKSLEYNTINTKLLKNINGKFESTLNFHHTNTTDTNTGNDLLAHETILGYAQKNIYTTIFWNNAKIAQFIDKNTGDTSTKKLSTISSGALLFDVNDAFDLRIITWDRGIFETQGKLVKKDFYEATYAGGVASRYLQNDGTFSTGVTNAKWLNFRDNNYTIFVRAESGAVFDYVKYIFSVTDVSGSGTYINPLRDDLPIREYLGNDIISYQSGFIWKMDTLKGY